MKRLSWRTQGRVVWPWLASLGAAGLAAWAAERHLAMQSEHLQQSMRVVEAERLVAGQRLEAGTILSLGLLATRKVPVAWGGSHGLVPADAARVQGRALAWSVQAGEPLAEMHLAEPPPARLSARLAPGRRAITINVGQVSAQAGLLQPGDRIDLFVNLPRAGRRATTALLQDVVVLATGQAMDGEPVGLTHERGFRTVTLDVSRDDALLLLAARQEGEMIAVLRAVGDQTIGPAHRGVSLAQLLGEIAPPPAPPQIAVLYGDRRTTRVPALDEPVVQDEQEFQDLLMAPAQEVAP